MPDAELDPLGDFGDLDGPQPDIEDVNLLSIDDLVFAASLVLGAPHDDELHSGEADPFGWGTAMG